MTFAPPFQRTFSSTFDRRAAAGGAWWNLFGAISNANVVAAYQAKGAASLAASYINLVTPGTYDAAPGTAPTWDATNGWIFTAASSQYLTTGITPPNLNLQTWSAIIRYSSAADVTTAYLFGASQTGGSTYAFGIKPRHSTNSVLYYNGLTGTATPKLLGGVLAIAGNTGYRNGVSEATITVGLNIIPNTIYIGSLHQDIGATLFYGGNIQVIAFYNNNQAANMAALYTAIAAL